MSVPHHVNGSGAPDVQPAEADDPRNRLLDAFAEFVAALRANDMGLQARERIRSVWPELFAAPPSANRPPDGPANGLDGGIEARLELAALITDCARLEKLRLSGPAHAAIARLKARAKADLAALQANPTEAKTDA